MLAGIFFDIFSNPGLTRRQMENAIHQSQFDRLCVFLSGKKKPAAAGF
jgi:hypothetical protein